MLLGFFFKLCSEMLPGHRPHKTCQMKNRHRQRITIWVPTATIRQSVVQKVPYILIECILQPRHQKKKPTHLQALFITCGSKPKSLPHSVWRYSHVLPHWLSYVLFHPPHRFHSNFDLVSEWLAGANKHLKTLSGLVNLSDLSQECVQSNLIKLLVRLFCVLIK